MGSSGSYSADVYITVPLKQKESNTEEAVSEFLTKSKIKAIREIKTEGLNSDKLLKLFEKIKVIYKFDSEDSDETYESAIKYNDNYKVDEIADILELIEDYDEDSYELFYVEDVTYADLKNINLELLKKSKMKYLDSSLEYKETILSCSESIYYENDNSSGDSKKVDNKLLELLSIPGAYINLSANGSSY